jgi:hypothetical protein
MPDFLGDSVDSGGVYSIPTCIYAQFCRHNLKVSCCFLGGWLDGDTFKFQAKTRSTCKKGRGKSCIYSISRWDTLWCRFFLWIFHIQISSFWFFSLSHSILVWWQHYTHFIWPVIISEALITTRYVNSTFCCLQGYFLWLLRKLVAVLVTFN